MDEGFWESFYRFFKGLVFAIFPVEDPRSRSPLIEFWLKNFYPLLSKDFKLDPQ